jgi:hypothetical protein
MLREPVRLEQKKSDLKVNALRRRCQNRPTVDRYKQLDLLTGW